MGAEHPGEACCVLVTPLSYYCVCMLVPSFIRQVEKNYVEVVVGYI